MASERPEVVSFFSALQSGVFKPRGYTKLRRTFQKEGEVYALAFQFQGSAWNSAGSPWRFYLNIGIRFSGIPRRQPDRDFPTIHSWTRVGRTITEWAEPHYDVPKEEQRVLVGKVAAMIEDSERYFSRMHAALRQSYEAKQSSFLGYLDEALMKR